MMADRDILPGMEAEQQQHKNNFDPKLQVTGLDHHKGLWGGQVSG